MDVSIADGDSGHQAGSWAQTTVLVRTAGRQSVKARGRDEGSEVSDTGQWSRVASVRAEPEVRIHGSQHPRREQTLRAGLMLLHGSAGASGAETQKGSQNKPLPEN